MNKNNALLALSTAAACLPGMNAQAQQIAQDFKLGFRHHSYQEDALDASRVLNPQLDRYDINVNQFQLVAPVSDTVQVNVDYQRENMSGASPWYTFQRPGETVQQVMSGASIWDTRTDVGVAVKVALDRDTLTLSAARSGEDDYESRSFGIKYALETENRLGTWEFGYDVSNDDINPVDADIFTTRPDSEQTKHSNSYLVSYSHIVNKQFLVKAALGYSRKSGYLSDPYKMVLVNNRLQGDTRPTLRNAKTFAVQSRYFVDAANAALHADYRYYNDSWGVRSHTFDIAWYQNLGWNIQLTPSIRIYNQSEADFYSAFYTETRDDGFYSTDYRLSEYGAVSYGLTLRKAIDNWSFMVRAEKYQSGGKTGLADAQVENPALLDFDLFSIGVDFTF